LKTKKGKKKAGIKNIAKKVKKGKKGGKK